jgi:hypothetical protein
MGVFSFRLFYLQIMQAITPSLGVMEQLTKQQC